MTGAYDRLKALTSDTAVAAREHGFGDLLELHGLDLAGIMRFCAQDAGDTLTTFEAMATDELATIAGVPTELADDLHDLLATITTAGRVALLSLLAMHEHVGLMLGLALARGDR